MLDIEIIAAQLRAGEPVSIENPTKDQQRELVSLAVLLGATYQSDFSYTTEQGSHLVITLTLPDEDKAEG